MQDAITVRHTSMLSGPFDKFQLHKLLPLAKTCKGCGRKLKNKKKYYLLREPKSFQGGHWAIVKVCTKCGAHNYKRKDEDTENRTDNRRRASDEICQETGQCQEGRPQIQGVM